MMPVMTKWNNIPNGLPQAWMCDRDANRGIESMFRPLAEILSEHFHKMGESHLKPQLKEAG